MQRRRRMQPGCTTPCRVRRRGRLDAAAQWRPVPRSPFELDSTRAGARSAPLYCYRPLTGELHRDHRIGLARLPLPRERRARGWRSDPTSPATQRRAGACPRGRLRRASAADALPGEVFAEQADFVFAPSA